VNPATAILEYAELERIELIAMATHGRTGVQRLLIGSVADKVMRGAFRPILLLRPA
jgi:nucleotide-binding universal stress UspA family protein